MEDLVDKVGEEGNCLMDLEVFLEGEVEVHWLMKRRIIH